MLTRAPAAYAPRARWLRIVQLMVMLFVGAIGADAWALGSVAGMCDPVGASAPAPLPALPANGGTIDISNDCDRLEGAFGDARDSRDTAGQNVDDSRPIAGAGAMFKVVDQDGETLPVPIAASAAYPSGHRSGVYRPPR